MQPRSLSEHCRRPVAEGTATCAEEEEKTQVVEVARTRTWVQMEAPAHGPMRSDPHNTGVKHPIQSGSGSVAAF